MNSNLFQTILTVLLTACGIVTSILLGFGCTQDAAGAVSCAASSAPSWLAPYLVITASALGIVKLITGAMRRLSYCRCAPTLTNSYICGQVRRSWPCQYRPQRRQTNTGDNHE